VLKNCFDIAETIDCRLLQRIDRVMAMLNLMMTTDVAGSPCWMRPGGWTQVGILKTMGCMGSVVKPHKWLLLKRPWEFVKELFRTYLLKVYRFDEPKHYLSCIFNGLRLSRKDHGIYPESVLSHIKNTVKLEDA